MTDGIGRIGGGNYGYGVGFGPRKNEEEAPQNAAAQTPAHNHEETQIDPSQVMEFLAGNNFFVVPTKEAAPAGQVDAATQDRIAGYMENFEMIYSVIAKEFGHELAPVVMDYAMDYLMGLAA